MVLKVVLIVRDTISGNGMGFRSGFWPQAKVGEGPVLGWNSFGLTPRGVTERVDLVLHWA
jgi:hypothetical protein